MFHIEGNLATGKSLDIHRQPLLLGQHGDDLAGGNAAVLIELIPLEGDAELGAGELPSIQMEGHGIYQSAIHIENQGIVVIKPVLLTLAHGGSSNQIEQASRLGTSIVGSASWLGRCGRRFFYLLLICETIIRSFADTLAYQISESAYDLENIPQNHFL